MKEQIKSVKQDVKKTAGGGACITSDVLWFLSGERVRGGIQN